MMNENKKLILIGKNIAKYRKAKGLTQNGLAEILDIYREHIAKIETAKRCPSLNLLLRIAEALNVSEKDLFDFSEME